MSLMAAESGADVRVVGLTHAVRILVLLLAIPPLLQLVGHVSVQAGRPAPEQWLTMPPAADILILAGAGLAGVWLGRRLRLPNPLLFGPVLVSGCLHLTGVTDAAIPPLIVALAQVIIGASIGVRFAGTSLARVGSCLAIALLQAVAGMLIAVATAWIGHLVSGYPPAAVLLAYMPGGAPELSLVALALGVEPAFVTSHHLLRITLLILLLPALVRLVARLDRR